MDYSSLSSEQLIRACASSGAASAWEEFVRRFHRLIASVVLRTARRWENPSPQLVDDLIQETYLKLCQDNFYLLRSFEFRQEVALHGYIKVLTANLVRDYFKASRSQKRGGAMELEPADKSEMIADLCRDQSGVKSAENNIFISEVDACLRSLQPQAHAERDRGIFWLYYRIGLPASAIASLPTIGLTTKGVESTLLRLTRHVKDRLSLTRAPGPRTGRDVDKGIESAESF
jgi:RNA polymerase sigma-70 factor (ECF subfamily)